MAIGAAELVVIALLYFAVAKGSLAFASIHPSATPVWPPTGLALALTLLRGGRVLPAILLGSAAANLATMGTLATSLAIACGNTLEAFAGAWLTNRWAGGRDVFETPTGIGKFTLIVAGAGTPISATVGGITLGMADLAPWASLPAIWATWWLGNVAGAVMVTPAILLWARERRSPGVPKAATWEFGLIILFAIVIGAVALGPLPLPTSGRNALAFLAVLPLLWSALRCGRRETAAVALLLSAFAIWGAAMGTGPFVQPSLNASLLTLVSFVAATTLPSLALSAAVRTRDRELVRTERDYRRLVDGIRDYAIFMLDAEGRVATWNSGAERIKKYPAGEIVGSHFRCFYTKEDRARNEPERTLAAADETGRSESEGWRVRRDGSRFRANVVISAIRDEADRLVGFTNVTRDITQAHEAQQALDQARDRLHQAQKLEAIGRLTGGVAHDFNNLMMALSGGLNLLSSGKPERREAVLQEMRLAVERATNLTRQLLAFARREKLHPQVIGVAEILSAMRILLKRAVGAEYRIEYRIGRGLWPVDVDPGQLEMAILNLAINARDAMPGGGAITVAAENASGPAANEAAAFVRIAVTDTGFGMTAEVRERAFEPFFSTKGAGRGTGLGLSQVHGFAEQSGGTVAIESSPGHGTTVTLLLPRARRRAASPVAVQPEPAAVAGAGSVLVVEDDDRVATIVCQMIEELGYDVTRVAGAAEALAAVEGSGPFDLVFSDIAMPGEMNGIQLAAAIRVLQPMLPVVLTTGYTDAADLPEARFPILHKPYGADQLSAAFRAALSAP